LDPCQQSGDKSPQSKKTADEFSPPGNDLAAAQEITAVGQAERASAVLHPDPSDPNKMVLVVGSSTHDDKIKIATC
jgi:hypothetical protein